MSKVSPFHTTNDESNPPSHRNVYHDQSECHYGKAIKAGDKVSGTGNRPKCSECVRLS
ncbi:MAG TPA: hypothetical protein VNW92_06875 [Polyangiaceae bacterium]|jgi:hypothetical protein|nr:hypothetical protein [Polyangiaceae bacterium]